MKNIVLLEKRKLKKILKPLNYPCKIKPKGKNIPIYRITFEHEYFLSFWKRTFNWFEYYVHKILNFFRSEHKKLYEPFKPLHLKRSCMPINEAVFKKILNKNGFMVIEEHLGSTYTAYDVTKK